MASWTAWRACRPLRSQWQHLSGSWRAQKEEGQQGVAQEQTVGDLSPGMLLGTARVRLASVPHLPIKIKEIDFLLFASED